jgi:hypothetical protein
VHLPVHGSSEGLASVATGWRQQQRAEVSQQQLDALVNTYRPIRCAGQLSGAHASQVLVPRLWGLYITIARLFDPLLLNLRNRSNRIIGVGIPNSRTASTTRALALGREDALTITASSTTLSAILLQSFHPYPNG